MLRSRKQTRTTASLKAEANLSLLHSVRVCVNEGWEKGNFVTAASMVSLCCEQQKDSTGGFESLTDCTVRWSGVHGASCGPCWFVDPDV